jgi:hypothetical protein
MSDRLTADIEWIPLGDLDVVYRRAQRPLRIAWARQIADEFDPNLFGIIEVLPKNGHEKYHVANGQHRTTALRLLEWPDTQCVPCQIKDGAGEREAAHLFSGLNNNLKQTAIERFNVAVTAGEPLETAVSETLATHGWRTTGGSESSAFGAVAAAVNITKRYGIDAFADTIRVLTDVWHHDRDTVVSTNLWGVATLIAVYDVDQLRLVNKMYKHAPGQLIGDTKQSRSLLGGTGAQNATRVLAGWYNSGLRSGRIEVK